MTEGDLKWIKNWQPQQTGNNMNRFYKKPKPETMKKNRELYAELYKDEIKWLSENFDKLQKHNKFLIEMCIILKTGGRKITPKMESAIKNSIEKCKNNPLYNEVLRVEQEAKLQPILSKINVVLAMAEAKNDKAVDFIKNVENYVRTNYKITKKQMEALNKVHKRVSEDLFKGDEQMGWLEYGLIIVYLIILDKWVFKGDE